MFYWNSLAFSMIQRMLAIWSLVPLPFLKPAGTSGSSWFMYCWSLAWGILSITKESWAPKNWCFWTVVLEKTLESLLDCKEIQLIHPKGDKSWVFIGRTDVKAENPILWPPDAKSWLIGKDLDAAKDWGQEKKETTGWDGWLASPTQWTWVCVDSRSWWWTGRPGVLRFTGSQGVRHDLVTEQQIFLRSL